MRRKNIAIEKINDDAIKKCIEEAQKLIDEFNNTPPPPFEAMLENINYGKKIITMNKHIKEMESKIEDYRISILCNFNINGFSDFYIYDICKKMDSVSSVIEKINEYISDEESKKDKIFTLNSELDQKSSLIERYNEYLSLLHFLKDKCQSLKDEVYILFGEKISVIHNKISNEEIDLPIRPNIIDVINFLERTIYLQDIKKYKTNDKIKVIDMISTIRKQIQNHVDLYHIEHPHIKKAMNLLDEVEKRFDSKI